MSDNEFDAFGDVINQQAGIFGSDASALAPGLEHYDQTVTTPSAKGVLISMFCRGCGRPKEILAQWLEMLAIAHNVPPHIAFQGIPGYQNPVVWNYSESQSAWWPDVRCPNCQTHCAPLVTPEEAGNLIKQALRQKWIPAAAVQQYGQRAEQFRIQLGR